MLGIRRDSILDLTEIRELIPECCNTAAIDINEFYDHKKEHLEDYLSSVKSIIVLGHHIEKFEEWVWNQFKFETEACIADVHTKEVMKKISSYIELQDHNSKIIPYSGVSGVRFKKIAAKSNLGEIGDNHLFLHRDWGPWVHLRVIITDAEIESSPQNKVDQVCIHCDNCIEACPINAIKRNDFNRQRCKDRHEKLNLSHSCEICAKNCPIGETPEKINK